MEVRGRRAQGGSPRRTIVPPAFQRRAATKLPRPRSLLPSPPPSTPHTSRKTTLRSDEESLDSVPARFDSALWPRVDAQAFPEGATLRLDAYRLKCAADGEGDWCAARVT